MQPIFREWHRAWLARRNGSHCSEKPTLYNGGWCYSGSCRLLWPYFLPLPFSSCLSSSSQRGLSWPFTGSFLYPHHPLNILFYILLRIHPSLQFFLSFFSEFIVHVSQWNGGSRRGGLCLALPLFPWHLEQRLQCLVHRRISVTICCEVYTLLYPRVQIRKQG